MIKIVDILVPHKDPMHKKQRLGAVHRIPCKDYKLCYVERLRRLHTESGCGLRSGLWPTAVFPHAARTP